MMSSLFSCLTQLGLLFVVQISLASSTVQRHDLKSTKLQCTKVELQTKDCSLINSPHKIHLTKNKISSYDGVWRALLKTPLVDAKSEWHDASLRPLQRRLFLSLYVWSPPHSSGVEDLAWYVYEILEKEIRLKKESIVQKRRPMLEAHPANGKSTHEKQFVFDSMLKHNLGLNKENKVEVTVDAEKSILED